MAKIAIVVDDYKVDKLKQELDKAGIVYAQEKGIVEKTVTFICYSNQETVAKICVKVQKYFENKYKAEN